MERVAGQWKGPLSAGIERRCMIHSGDSLDATSKVTRLARICASCVGSEKSPPVTAMHLHWDECQRASLWPPTRMGIGSASGLPGPMLISFPSIDTWLWLRKAVSQLLGHRRCSRESGWCFPTCRPQDLKSEFCGLRLKSSVGGPAAKRGGQSSRSFEFVMSNQPADLSSREA
jgi:hypothetical protein